MTATENSTFTLFFNWSSNQSAAQNRANINRKAYDILRVITDLLHVLQAKEIRKFPPGKAQSYLLTWSLQRSSMKGWTLWSLPHAGRQFLSPSCSMQKIYYSYSQQVWTAWRICMPHGFKPLLQQTYCLVWKPIWSVCNSHKLQMSAVDHYAR